MRFLFILVLFFSANCFAGNYLSDSVFVKNDSLILAGTLTYPSGEGKYPAAIIISGTGKQDRDGTFGTHKPFLEIADYLSRQGFAVFRIDDRGVGKSTGVYNDATTRDFASDVLAEIDFLKTLPQIDTNRIGLIGHSEGGTVAFMVGASSPDVSFLISLAGLVVDGYTSLLLQNRAILNTNPNLSAQAVEDYMDMYTMLFDAIKNTPPDEDAGPVLDTAFEEWYKNQNKEKLERLGFVEGRDNYFLARYKRLALRPWYREMIQLRPADYLSRIRVPVLALNGDKDIMVTAEENLSIIEQNLKTAGNKNYRVLKLEGLNHMFQHCQKCNNEEMQDLPEAIAPEVLKEISSWLQELYF